MCMEVFNVTLCSTEVLYIDMYIVHTIIHMHRVSVCIAETNTYVRTCAVTLLHYYIGHIPVPVPLAGCGPMFETGHVAR